MRCSLLGSWIDLNAAASAARDLCPPEFLPASPDDLLPAGPMPLSPGDLNLADDYQVDRFPSATTPAAPAAAIHSRLTEIRERAERAGLLAAVAGESGAAGLPATAAPAATTPPPRDPTPESAGGLTAAVPRFVPPLGPLNFRIHAFAHWLRQAFCARTVFVTDAQGRPLVEFEALPGVVAGAIVMADAAIKARRHFVSPNDSAVPVHVDLGPGATLTLITTEIRGALFHTGLVLREPLEAESARSVARALRRTIEAGS